jgi:hypothetical protein
VEAAEGDGAGGDRLGTDVEDTWEEMEEDRTVGVGVTVLLAGGAAKGILWK